MVEGHKGQAGHGVQRPLPEIHPVGQAEPRVREMIESERSAHRVLQPRRRHETVEVDERNVEEFGQQQGALIEEAVNQDEMEFLVQTGPHQLAENRILVDGPAVVGHRFGHTEEQPQGMVTIAEIDVMLAIDFGHDGRVEHPHITIAGPIAAAADVAGRFEAVPVGDKVSALGQRRHQRLEHVRVAGRGDGRQDENVVAIGGGRKEQHH